MAASAEEITTTEEERLLRYYTGTRGADITPLGKLGPNAILKMAESLRNPDEPRKGAIIPALAKAIEVMPASNEIKAHGRAAIYEVLKSQNALLRRSALLALRDIDGERATEKRWLEMLNDPEESIRIQALGLLEGDGRPDVWPQIETILERGAGVDAGANPKGRNIRVWGEGNFAAQAP